MVQTRLISAQHKSSRARTLDESQRTILGAPLEQCAVVLGAPGTGKTATLIALVAHRVANGTAPDDIIVMTPGRQAANHVRDELATVLHSATNGALARTPMSLAFAIAAERAQRDGRDAPRLLTGSEQDQIFSELLVGEILDRTGNYWPESLSAEVRTSRVFRTELRELFARCVDIFPSTSELSSRNPHTSPLGHGGASESAGVSGVSGVSDVSDFPARLSERGRLSGRAEWVAAGQFWRTYIDTVSQAKTNYYDSSEMLAIASEALDDHQTLANVKLVIVDDAQELTYGAANMLRAFAARKIPVVMFGDPDVASTTFRGAVPNLLGQADAFLETSVQTHVLSHVHRHGPGIRGAVSAVTNRIGTAAAGTQRRAISTPQTPALKSAAAITLLERGSQSAEWASLARILREHHIFGGVPYSRMAVIVRSGNLLPHLARALAVNEVPSRTLVSDRSLRDQPIVRALISVVDVALGGSPLTVTAATELLLSPIAGLSVLDLRRLRLSLRHEELLTGGSRTGEELLPDAIVAPGRLATIDSRPARRASRFAQILDGTRTLAARGGSIEELFWCAWEGSRLSEAWATDALGTGLVADDANRNLDSVMALFTSAKRFVERQPDRPAADFIAEVLAADIPEDSLAPQALAESVLVCTPTAVVGAEYDVVVVASLQEGIWPNVRLRGSLFHPQDIVASADGNGAEVGDARKHVIEDELRMFALALSRATSHVILTATRDDDAQPSPFYRLMTLLQEKSDSSSDWRRDLPRGREIPLSLRGLVGSLRRSLTQSLTSSVGELRSTASIQAASVALAVLAQEEVPGAHPNGWYGLSGPSTSKPLVDFVEEPDHLVNVSPSKLEAWEKNQLGWFISSTIGNQSSSAMGVGSLFHSVIEAVGDRKIVALDPQSLWKPIGERWHELSFEAPWESERERRRALKMVAALSSYLQEFKDSGAEVVAVECEFTVPIGHARLHGFIDRVEKDRDGNVVIVDLKTGAVPAGTNAEEHAQLLCYQFALVNDGIDNVAAGSTSGGARLLYLQGKQKSAAATAGATAAAMAPPAASTPASSAASTAASPNADLEPYTYKVLNQSPLNHEPDAEGIDPISRMQSRIEQAALGMAGESFTAVVYTREERGEYDSKYESRIHIIKAVSE